ncbi:YbfB/YjiJ family MFS transporter, partial [Klebsiella aerogenes]|nr:YbfB/YjiJ family MFS transporter [Klebsiella aerogenes]
MRQIRPEINAFLLAMAGATVLMIGMGYGRFAFTGILPVMLSDQILTLRQGNLAASANYAGYLLGALLLAKAKREQASRMNIVSVILTLICLAL